MCNSMLFKMVVCNKIQESQSTTMTFYPLENINGNNVYPIIINDKNPPNYTFFSENTTIFTVLECVGWADNIGMDVTYKFDEPNMYMPFQELLACIVGEHPVVTMILTLNPMTFTPLDI